MLRSMIVLAALCVFIFSALYAGKPETPKVERVKPLSPDPLKALPDVYFYENLETIKNLKESFHDIGSSDERFRISKTDAFSGRQAIEQTYIPISEMTGDPGDAGWCWRFFGDSPMYVSSIPEEQRKPYTTVVARWYHKFQEGFQPRDGLYYPNKMARMRCFGYGDWNSLYTVLFWIGGEDGHISIERHTLAPGVHREWQPNHEANFIFSNPENIGRWIHYELRVSLGEGARSDRIQAWADGVLICDVAGDDLAGGYRDLTLNGMSWDCYWNGGSPATQSRFYDDLVLSTEPVGPARTGFNPVICKSAFSSPDQEALQAGWEADVAQGRQKELEIDGVVDGVVTRYKPQEFEYSTVWQGRIAGDTNEVTVDTAWGEFVGPLKGKDRLAPNTLHFVRVRQQDNTGNWSDWSGWHSGFATTWAEGTPAEEMGLPEGYLKEARAAVLQPDSTAPVIRETLRWRDTPDTTGPYTITASVTEENLLDVYLYYRIQGEEEYSRVRMEEKDGAFSARIPGQSNGTTIQYYIRARDFQWNYTYDPPDFETEPYGFRVDRNALSCDFNRDGRVNIVDVVAFLIAGLREPDNPALDYDGDGSFSLSDPIAMLRDILEGRFTHLLAQASL
ncbi:MAG TPA: hypothetical protein VM123_06305 [archaeon]|nr:hypothetical protein [archaeon]